FYREQIPGDFEGIGSPEVGRRYALQIRARTEELTFALSPTVIDRHKIRSGRSEADAQLRTGASSRRGGHRGVDPVLYRMPGRYRRPRRYGRPGRLGPMRSPGGPADCRHGDAPFWAMHAAIGPRHGLATSRPLFRADYSTRGSKSGSRH